MHFLIRKNENLETQLGWTKNETQLGKPLSYFNWEESVKRTVYGLANTLINISTIWKSHLNLGNEFRNPTVKTPHLITHFQFTFYTLL
jgi:hypothetical protein